MKIEHPYQNLAGGEWLKGNLHAHSKQSDGAHQPQQVIDYYAEAGYDFLMMSDHDVHSSEATYAELDGKGMVLIPGNEITRDGVHILHVHADRFVPPHEERQQAIDEISGGRGFAVVAHPNWYPEFNHCSHTLLRGWQDYAGLEIYNGVIGRLDGSPYATDHWDRLLTHDRRVWGFAHDDFHDHGKGDLANGWNVVYAAERTPQAIADALRNGRFYPSTGVTISDISVTGSTIRIETGNAERIVALRDCARRIAVVDGPSAAIEVNDDWKYVRFECWGRGEQFAWTQPFRIG